MKSQFNVCPSGSYEIFAVIFDYPANVRQPYSLYDVIPANVLVRRPVIQICLSVSGEVQLGPQS